MFNVRPDALWLYVEPPPADEVLGFRMNPDGSVRDTPSAAPSGSFGLDPSASSSSSMGPGLQDAAGIAPGNIYSDACPAGLSGFVSPPRHPLQDALDQIVRIYAPFAPRAPGPFEPQGSGTDIVSPNVGRPLSPYAPPFQSRAPVASDGALTTVGPLGSFSGSLAGLETETTPPQAPKGLPAPDDQRGPSPWLEVNLPSRPESETPFGQMSSDAEPMSLPMPATGAGNPRAAFDDGTGVGMTPAGDAQIAQAPRPQQQRQNPPAVPKQQEPEPPASEQRFQVKATQKVERMSVWDDLIRKPLPEKIDPRLQQPLPDDWEAAVTKKDPNYLKWTKAAAEKYGIPPELLGRLINKESTYDRHRVSPRGAKGIAQLMPRAIEDLGLDPKTFDYFNAEKSINASAALLAKYYRHFKDWPKTVAAYNWGIGNLHNWLEGEKSAGPNDETQVTLMHVFRGNPRAFNKGP